MFKFYLRVNIPGLCYEFEYHECVSKKLATSPNLPGNCRNPPRTTGYFCRSLMKFRTPRISFDTPKRRLPILYGHPIPNCRFCWLLQIINILINDVLLGGLPSKMDVLVGDISFLYPSLELCLVLFQEAENGNLKRNMPKGIWKIVLPGRVFTAGLILHIFI